MYSKTQSGKSPKGSVGIESFRGRLRLRLPRSLYDGKQKYLSTEMLDNPEGWESANALKATIEADIHKDLIVPGTFDYSLVKYGRQPSRAQLTVVESISKPSLTLLELWEKFVAYKVPGLKAKTIQDYEGTTSLLRKIGNPKDALDVREQLGKVTTDHRIKRTVVYLNACYNWAMKHGLVTSNPYIGMSGDLPKYKWETDAKPNPFTQQEKQRIIEAFQNHKVKGGGISYSRYASFVEFLFLTGCRPSEAIGLQWKHVSDDLSKIRFESSIVQVSGGKQVRSNGSKNNRKRTFPCNEQLRVLLELVKTENASPESLVFPSPDGKPIHYNNFSRRAWNVIVDPIKPDTTPYCCRDTFISEQASKNVAAAIIAKWVDSSVKMIEKHYLDLDNVENLHPL